MATGNTGNRRLRLLVLALAAVVGLYLWLRGTPSNMPAAPMGSAAGSAAAGSASAQPPPRKRTLHVHRGETRIDLSDARTVKAEGIGAITGQVVSRGDGKGVSQPRLVFDDGALHTVVGDDLGRFTFHPSKEGVYELALVTAEGFLAFAPEYGHSPMVFAARRGAGLEGARVYLTPAIDYRVTVVSPEGEPVAGAEVVALGGRAAGSSLTEEADTWTTDSAGEAVVHGQDTTIFEARHADYAPGRARLDFGAQVSHRLTIRLREAGAETADATLSGQVVAEDGSPVPDALVVAAHEPENAAKNEALVPLARALTDASGRFDLTGLAAGGYRMSASAPGFAPVTNRKLQAPANNVTLELEKGAGLFGKVTGEDGTPIPSFVVVVREPLGPLRREVVVAEPTFDPDGEFAIPALPKGKLLVTVSSYGWAPSEEREVTIADEEVRADFTLDRGATVTGTVVDADTNEPIGGAKVSIEGAFGGRRTVQVYATARTEPDGRFDLRGVAPGPQSLLVAAADHHGKLVAVNLKLGDSDDITIALSPTEEGEEPRIELAGIGAVLSASGEVLVIGRVIEGGGAAAAGLGPDDAILAVDGIPVTKLGFAGAIRKIRGPVGSKVWLDIRKAGADAAIAIQVVRRKIRA
jgi:protocatechuate 3,4-dioxygenase beta subunit